MSHCLTEKECTKCLAVKPIEAFFKRKELKSQHMSWCKSCHSQYSRLRRSTAINAGLCAGCKQNQHYPNIAYCLDCWIMKAMRITAWRLGNETQAVPVDKQGRRNLLSLFSLTERRHLLEPLCHSLKLALQAGCPFTGEKLIIGENIHLDHRFPVKRFPAKAKAIDNLQWTSLTYNMHKKDMTDAEFYKFCKTVVANYERLNKS
jgi:hypothetical protein